MSVLETFYILFKSDADKAAKDLDKVDDAADKAERSLRKVDATNARLSASFMSMARSIAAPLLALASVGAITNLVTGRAENIRQLDQFSAKLNSTVGDVDAFQRSVQAAGGEGAKALDSLVKIGEKFNEAFSDKDSGARKDFEAWGLSFKDAQGNALGATDAMLALAGSIEGLSRAEALARIKKLGIEDAASIELLLKGRKEVERNIEVQKEMGVVTEEQAQITRDYYQALGGLGNSLTSVGNAMVTAFLPAITSSLDVMSRLVGWVTENQHLVEGFFIGVATIVTVRMIPAMWSLAAATLAALWPYLLITAAVIAAGAAFALAYEDFRAWADGQPSILGNLLGEYEAFVGNVEAVLGAFSWDNFMKDIEAIKQAFVDLGATITSSVGGAVQGVIDLIAGIPGAIKAAAIGVAAAAVTVGGAGGMVAPATAYTGGADPAAAAEYLKNGQWALGNASNAPQGVATPAGGNVTSNVSVGTVTVNTQATDAQGIAREVRGALQQEFRSTSSSLDDGVDR